MTIRRLRSDAHRRHSGRAGSRKAVVICSGPGGSAVSRQLHRRHRPARLHLRTCRTAELVVGYAARSPSLVSMLTLAPTPRRALAAGRVGAEWNLISRWRRVSHGPVFGVVVGLPALRLRTFYFAMTTLGFATIVTQVALAWKDVTGGGVGTPGPAFPWPFEPGWGFYYFCFILAALATWMTANIGSSRYGRALVAIRDAEVAAEASGMPSQAPDPDLPAGRRAGGVAGGLFCSLQSYITPTPSPSRCRCGSSSPS